MNLFVYKCLHSLFYTFGVKYRSKGNKVNHTRYDYKADHTPQADTCRFFHRLFFIPALGYIIPVFDKQRQEEVGRKTDDTIGPVPLYCNGTAHKRTRDNQVVQLTESIFCQRDSGKPFFFYFKISAECCNFDR